MRIKYNHLKASICEKHLNLLKDLESSDIHNVVDVMSKHLQLKFDEPVMTFLRLFLINYLIISLFF